MEKIVIFGAGTVGKKIYKHVLREGEVVAFVDSKLAVIGGGGWRSHKAYWRAGFNCV